MGGDNLEGVEVGATRKPGGYGTLTTIESTGGISLQVLDTPEIHNSLSHIPDKEEHFSWAFVIVFDVGSPDKIVELRDEQGGEYQIAETEHFAEKIVETLEALQKAGLRYTTYKSVQEDEIYCLIGITEKRCRREALRISYELKLNPERALRYGQHIGCRLAVKTISQNPEDSQCTEKLWNNIYGKYEQSDNPNFDIYEKYDDDDNYPNSLFKTTDRLKLIVSIIEAEEVVGGANLVMGRLIKKDKTHPATAFFPLHENDKKRQLREDWHPLKYPYFHQPLNDIRDYFGEYFALYFSFLGYYCKWLIFPAIFGLPFFVVQLAHDSPSVPGVWTVGIMISLWTTIFLERWKRREAFYRVQWGQVNFLTTEQPRPEFEGEWRSSSVTGALEEQYSFWKKFIKMFFSQTVIYSLIACVIAAVTGIFLLKEDWTIKELPNGSIYIGIINAVQIQIFNFIYMKVSEKLNHVENHRTDSEYENAMIAKSFLFKFVNSFSTLFYLAFFKRIGSVGCGLGSSSDTLPEGDKCLLELQTQLGTLFLSMIILNNLTEYLIPKLSSAYVRYQQGSGSADAEKTEPEKQFELATNDSTFSDYDELAIQFGFVSLFIIAWPITPLLALFNNFIEVVLDSRKLTILARRPEPRGVYSIGTWAAILETMSIITVLTNAAVIVFVSSDLRDFSGDEAGVYSNGYSKFTNVWIFLVLEHSILVLKFVLKHFIPDEPAVVTKHIARQEYIIDALINNVPDQADMGSWRRRNTKKRRHNQDKGADDAKYDEEEEDYEALVQDITVGYEPDDRFWV